MDPLVHQVDASESRSRNPKEQLAGDMNLSPMVEDLKSPTTAAAAAGIIARRRP
jgi:hypothetical protein